METKTESKKRVYVCLPKKHVAALAENYKLDHGLMITELNPYVNEGYIAAYFREWGTVTACKIKKVPGGKSLAYVRFSTEDETDRAHWAGPHCIGEDVEVRRVVCLKTDEDSEEEVDMAIAKPRPRRSMGLGYILEDAQWLDDENEE